MTSSSKPIHKEYRVKKVINQSKFSIYQVTHEETGEDYALKVFLYREGDINPCYKNEERL